MSRTVTNAFIAACNAQETDEVFIILVTFDHSILSEPIYLCNNSVNIVSRGKEFLALPMEITLSDDSDDRPPQAKIVFDNIDRRLVEIVRSIESPPSVSLEIIKLSDPETVEVELTDFILRGVDYNTLTIEGTLSLEGLFLEPAIGFSFTPSYFPGLF
jgi:hypothetical protein